ncbi:Single-stranded DNA-binding protein WHY2 mitochondrial [Bienertia sinuspersici]
MSCAGFSTFGQKESNNERIFAAYSVYKGKAALSAEPAPPKFCKLDSGGIRVKRQGYILLSFSPAVAERKYDWQRKQIIMPFWAAIKIDTGFEELAVMIKVFALSATEVGALIALGPNGSCEFFHDPAMQTSNAGQVRKSFSIRANPDGTGYFMSLNVVNNIAKTNDRFSLPITSAEFAVMRTSFSFALPHIMGWDRYSSQVPNFKEENSTKVGLKSLSSEWDR